MARCIQKNFGRIAGMLILLLLLILMFLAHEDSNFIGHSLHVYFARKATKDKVQTTVEARGTVAANAREGRPSVLDQKTIIAVRKRVSTATKKNGEEGGGIDFESALYLDGSGELHEKSLSGGGMPDGKARLRSVYLQRIELVYSSLFEKLGVSSDKRNSMIDILLNDVNANNEHLRNAVKSEHYDVSKEAEALAAIDERTTRQLCEGLSEDNANIVKEYRDNLPYRMVVEQIAFVCENQDCSLDNSTKDIITETLKKHLIGGYTIDAPPVFVTAEAYKKFLSRNQKCLDEVRNILTAQQYLIFLERLNARFAPK